MVLRVSRTLTLQTGQTQGLSALLVWRYSRNSNTTPVNRAPLHRARCIETKLKRLIVFVEKGGTLQSREDVPDNFREELYIEERHRLGS
jgi:hypothetical protein